MYRTLIEKNKLRKKIFEKVFEWHL